MEDKATGLVTDVMKDNAQKQAQDALKNGTSTHSSSSSTSSVAGGTPAPLSLSSSEPKEEKTISLSYFSLAKSVNSALDINEAGFFQQILFFCYQNFNGKSYEKDKIDEKFETWFQKNLGVTIKFVNKRFAFNNLDFTPAFSSLHHLETFLPDRELPGRIRRACRAFCMGMSRTKGEGSIPPALNLAVANLIAVMVNHIYASPLYLSDVKLRKGALGKIKLIVTALGASKDFDRLNGGSTTELSRYFDRCIKFINTANSEIEKSQQIKLRVLPWLETFYKSAQTMAKSLPPYILSTISVKKIPPDISEQLADVLTLYIRTIKDTEHKRTTGLSESRLSKIQKIIREANAALEATGHTATKENLRGLVKEKILTLEQAGTYLRWVLNGRANILSVRSQHAGDLHLTGEQLLSELVYNRVEMLERMGVEPIHALTLFTPDEYGVAFLFAVAILPFDMLKEEREIPMSANDYLSLVGEVVSPILLDFSERGLNDSVDPILSDWKPGIFSKLSDDEKNPDSQAKRTEFFRTVCDLITIVKTISSFSFLVRILNEMGEFVGPTLAAAMYEKALQELAERTRHSPLLILLGNTTLNKPGALARLEHLQASEIWGFQKRVTDDFIAWKEAKAEIITQDFYEDLKNGANALLACCIDIGKYIHPDLIAEELENLRRMQGQLEQVAWLVQKDLPGLQSHLQKTTVFIKGYEDLVRNCYKQLQGNPLPQAGGYPQKRVEEFEEQQPGEVLEIKGQGSVPGTPSKLGYDFEPESPTKPVQVQKFNGSANGLLANGTLSEPAVQLQTRFKPSTPMPYAGGSPKKPLQISTSMTPLSQSGSSWLSTPSPQKPREFQGSRPTVRQLDLSQIPENSGSMTTITSPRTEELSGNSIFFALFGDWNSVKAQYECDSAQRLQRKIQKVKTDITRAADSKSSSNSKTQEMQIAVREAILAQVRSGRSMGEHSEKLIQGYQIHLAAKDGSSSGPWQKFEAELDKHPRILMSITKENTKRDIDIKDSKSSAPSLRDQFHNTLQKGDGLYLKLRSNPGLYKAFLAYHQEQEKGFNFAALSSPEILEEYANFIDRFDALLSDESLKVIALSLDIHITYDSGLGIREFNEHADTGKKITYAGTGEFCPFGIKDKERKAPFDSPISDASQVTFFTLPSPVVVASLQKELPPPPPDRKVIETEISDREKFRQLLDLPQGSNIFGTNIVKDNKSINVKPDVYSEYKDLVIKGFATGKYRYAAVMKLLTDALVYLRDMTGEPSAEQKQVLCDAFSFAKGQLATMNDNVRGVPLLKEEVKNLPGITSFKTKTEYQATLQKIVQDCPSHEIGDEKSGATIQEIRQKYNALQKTPPDIRPSGEPYRYKQLCAILKDAKDVSSDDQAEITWTLCLQGRLISDCHLQAERDYYAKCLIEKIMGSIGDLWRGGPMPPGQKARIRENLGRIMLGHLADNASELSTKKDIHDILKAGLDIRVNFSGTKQCYEYVACIRDPAKSNIAVSEKTALYIVELLNLLHRVDMTICLALPKNPVGKPQNVTEKPAYKSVVSKFEALDSLAVPVQTVEDFSVITRVSAPSVVSTPMR